jgi:hypothetical protein
VPVSAPPVVVDWVDSAGPEILVLDLHADTLSVMVATDLDFTKIPNILVTMHYEDAANNVAYNDVIRLSSTANFLPWAHPIVDKTKRDYTYGVTLMYADHTVKTFPPIPSSDQVLDITDTFIRNMNVVVSASGDDFDTAGLDRVELSLSYADGGAPQQTLSVVLRSLTDTSIFSYQVHDPAHMSYSYSGTYFAKNGFNHPIQQTSSDKPNLVIPVGAAS